MKKLKILFNTSPGAFSSWGGGEIQMLETKKELEKMGHEVKILEKENYQVDWESFDIFHNFNIHRNCWQYVQEAMKKNLPIAVSTIYWPSPIKHAFAWNQGFGKKVMIIGSKTISGTPTIQIGNSNLNKVGAIVESADILMPNSEAEKEMLMKKFGIEDKKVHVVPNGVDIRFKNANTETFLKKYEKYKSKDFVLYVGRLEERKNVLSLIKAMKGTRENLVIIGKAKQGSEDYAKKCIAETDNYIEFIDSIPHDDKLLKSAYAACKVFCLPSWYETPGLAALEAGLAGANIVITKEGCTKEYFDDFAVYIDPANDENIKHKILAQIKNSKNRRLSTHIEKKYLWKNAAVETEKAYNKIIRSKTK